MSAPAYAESVLRVGFVDGPQGMDPALAVLGSSHQIIDLVYSGLTKLDKDANPIPDLAESWTIYFRRENLHVQASTQREVSRRHAVHRG